MSQTDLIQDLAKLRKVAPDVPQFPSIFLAVCTDNKDPFNLHRVKVQVLARDGDAESDWFQYCSPSRAINLDLPQLGDWLCCFYADGDPRRGFWFGFAITETHRLPFSSNEGDIIIESSANIVIKGKQAILIQCEREARIETTTNECSLNLDDDGDVSMRSGLLEFNLRDWEPPVP